jgi:dipeptidyl aminopeptidase/acylaminoacyl peptidase
MGDDASPLEAGNVITIVPVEPGEPRKLTIPVEPVGAINWRWSPDGKRLIVTGNEPGRPRRSYEYVIDTGKMRPLTPEGITGTLISPDGRAVAVTSADGKQLIWPLEGGEPRDHPGMTPQDAVLHWADGRSMFIGTPSSINMRTISRLDVVSGRRQMLTTIAPSDVAGVRTLAFPFISADVAPTRIDTARYSPICSSQPGCVETIGR